MSDNKTMFGTVDKNGVIRYEHHDLNEVRAFLRHAGMECSHKGWLGNGFIGAIEFHKGIWHSYYFKE